MTNNAVLTGILTATRVLVCALLLTVVHLSQAHQQEFPQNRPILTVDEFSQLYSSHNTLNQRLKNHRDKLLEIVPNYEQAKSIFQLVVNHHKFLKHSLQRQNLNHASRRRRRRSTDGSSEETSSETYQRKEHYNDVLRRLMSMNRIRNRNGVRKPDVTKHQTQSGNNEGKSKKNIQKGPYTYDTENMNASKNGATYGQKSEVNNASGEQGNRALQAIRNMHLNNARRSRPGNGSVSSQEKGSSHDDIVYQRELKERKERLKAIQALYRERIKHTVTTHSSSNNDDNNEDDDNVHNTVATKSYTPTVSSTTFVTIRHETSPPPTATSPPPTTGTSTALTSTKSTPTPPTTITKMPSSTTFTTKTTTKTTTRTTATTSKTTQDLSSWALNRQKLKQGTVNGSSSYHNPHVSSYHQREGRGHSQKAFHSSRNGTAITESNKGAQSNQVHPFLDEKEAKDYLSKMDRRFVKKGRNPQYAVTDSTAGRSKSRSSLGSSYVKSTTKTKSNTRHSRRKDKQQGGSSKQLSRLEKIRRRHRNRLRNRNLNRKKKKRDKAKRNRGRGKNGRRKSKLIVATTTLRPSEHRAVSNNRYTGTRSIIATNVRVISSRDKSSSFSKEMIRHTDKSSSVYPSSSSSTSSSSSSSTVSTSTLSAFSKSPYTSATTSMPNFDDVVLEKVYTLIPMSEHESESDTLLRSHEENVDLVEEKYHDRPYRTNNVNSMNNNGSVAMETKHPNKNHENQSRSKPKIQTKSSEADGLESRNSHTSSTSSYVKSTSDFHSPHSVSSSFWTSPSVYSTQEPSTSTITPSIVSKQPQTTASIYVSRWIAWAKKRRNRNKNKKNKSRHQRRKMVDDNQSKIIARGSVAVSLAKDSEEKDKDQSNGKNHGGHKLSLTSRSPERKTTSTTNSPKSPFINHKTAYDFLTKQKSVRVYDINERRRETYVLNKLMGENMCEIFNKNFVPTSNGGKCE